MKPVTRAYFELHLAVLLFGLTAILGKLILLSAIVMVWWRMLLTTISLILLVNVARLLRQLPRRLILQYMGIGGLVALHWITFFGSIKLSNASITLTCFATTGFFTAFIEPLVLGHKVKGFEIGLGLLVIPGMALVVGNTEWAMMAGIGVGLLSALLASLFSSLNKKLIHKADSLSITLIELSSGWLLICLVLPFFFESSMSFWPSRTDWIYLVILAFLCTTLAYVLALRSLKHLTAFTSMLTINLEPVYGILLAWIILNENEELNSGFYWGVGIILAAVFGYPFLRRRFGSEST